MDYENDNLPEEGLDNKGYDSRLMRRLLGFAGKYWHLFALAVVFLFASTVVDLARPILTGMAIDDFIKKGDIPSLNKMALYFVILIAAGFLFNLLQVYLLSYAGQFIIYNIRQLVFSHLQRLPLSYFDKNPIGRLVTRITNDTETLNDMYTNVLVTLLKDFSILLGAIIIMLRLNVRLTLIVLAVMPFVAVVTSIFRIKIRKVYRDIRVALARVNSSISENISGMHIIQLFNKERSNFAQFNETGRQYYKATMNEVTTVSLFRPLIEMLSSLAIALLIWFGGSDVVGGTLGFGVLYAFINYVALLFQPINDLAEKYNILQSSMAASERIFMILDTPAEKDEGSFSDDNSPICGDIEFKNVCFAYNEGDWVLKDVSFKVPKGKTVAIVGHTGAGKTSLINLLSRFYEIQGGEILINGINIKDIRKDSLRKSIGVVLQDVFLFSGRLMDNIRLNEKSITDEKIKEVSRYVNADIFISRLPNGYQEDVMERGSTLSSGQRQLLAFARALAFDPAILVLDEATSNIDTETELLIQDALAKLTHGRTTVIIAHRLSTIQHADSIIVLHKGRVHEMGTHQELLAAKGMYYSLYQLQYQPDA
ncbi:ATP-binding cassette subfamily B protein [Anaerobacterium chartisolvens]|uniref:ATP-binding cassette subfamily B protein n=1 Tax=Anaerobacterium chartisolvens TaxID=1297424 RepID=A0A369AKI5_9FIRM|nr:ABC transporter ATP-binding protein [Anaerobacterium chartisolvens]RCX09872.1 ATP-binding cassette subfamily B protein [Anaerobacterium chartisolvens]